MNVFQRSCGVESGSRRALHATSPSGAPTSPSTKARAVAPCGLDGGVDQHDDLCLQLGRRRVASSRVSRPRGRERTPRAPRRSRTRASVRGRRGQGAAITSGWRPPGASSAAPASQGPQWAARCVRRFSGGWQARRLRWGARPRRRRFPPRLQPHRQGGTREPADRIRCRRARGASRRSRRAQARRPPRTRGRAGGRTGAGRARARRGVGRGGAAPAECPGRIRIDGDAARRI